MSSFTKEQLTKLECDAYAYAQAFLSLIKIREDKRAHPGSTAFTSLTTAAAVNFCFAMELQLKLILIRTCNDLEQQNWRVHELYEIYELLSTNVQGHLDNIKKKVMRPGRSIIMCYVHSRNHPQVPEDTLEVKTFGDLMKFLDSCGFAYTKARYSWIEYSHKDWFYVLEAELLVNLYDEITRYTNN